MAEIDIDDPIQVHIEGEDDAPAAGSSARRTSDADRRAGAAEGEAARQRLASARLQRQSDLSRLEQELLTMESESKAAEQAFEQAADLGDIRGQAAANRRMSIAESRRVALEQRQSWLQHAPVSSGNPTEDYLSNFTDRTASWLREHSEYISDPRKNAQVQGAHHMAIAAGEVPDTPGYFAHVEKTLKIRGNGRGDRSGGNVRSGSSDYDRNDVNTHVRDGGKAVYLTSGEIERSEDGSLIFNVGERDARGNVITRNDPRVGKPIGRETFAYRKAQLAKQGAYSKLG
jgi:hypothetical protein